MDNIAALAKTCEEIKKHPIIGIDTESNSLFAYQEQVCLIQITANNIDYLIDPLGIPDLSAMGVILADPKIEKVFHAAEYDIICLKRDFDFEVTNIFDTMHACRILGEHDLGLSAQLEKHIGYVHNKKFQRADWGKRPLTEEMLSYARIDSHFLIRLRDILREQLRAKRLMPLAAEDFLHLTMVQPTTAAEENGQVWRILGNTRLPAEKVSILQALIDYRENYAIKADVPPFKVLGNSVLLEIAQAAPQNKVELAQCGLTERNLERHAKGLLATVKVGATQPMPPRSGNHHPGNTYLRRYDLLRKWRKEKGIELGVESDIVLPKTLMESFAANAPQSKSALRAAMHDYPWRFEHYSDDLLKLLKEKQ